MKQHDRSILYVKCIERVKDYLDDSVAAEIQFQSKTTLYSLNNTISNWNHFCSISTMLNSKRPFREPTAYYPSFFSSLFCIVFSCMSSFFPLSLPFSLPFWLHLQAHLHSLHVLQCQNFLNELDWQIWILSLFSSQLARKGSKRKKQISQCLLLFDFNEI